MGASDLIKQVLNFENFPHDSLSVFLFKNVSNTSEIKQAIVAASFEPEASIFNAEHVLDIFILHAAAYKALEAYHRKTMKTRSIHSEIVYSISGSKHIGESLTKFGVNEECKHLLIARMNATPEELNAISGMIRGESVPVEELTKLCDVDLITKLYKITKEELGVGGVEDAILCRIAARDTL